MKNHKRLQLFVDPHVQGVFLLRTVLYWAFSFVMLTLIMVCWRILTGPSRPIYVHLDYLWFHYKPAAIASTLLLPILVVDMLRMTNRFAGPMVRLRRAMRRLADGELNIEAIHFRNKDFWNDFAAEFNRLVERLNEEEQMAKESADAEGAPESDADDSAIGDTLPGSPSADDRVEAEPVEETLVGAGSE